MPTALPRAAVPPGGAPHGSPSPAAATGEGPALGPWVDASRPRLGELASSLVRLPLLLA